MTTGQPSRLAHLTQDLSAPLARGSATMTAWLYGKARQRTPDDPWAPAWRLAAAAAAAYLTASSDYTTAITTTAATAWTLTAWTIGYRDPDPTDNPDRGSGDQDQLRAALLAHLDTVTAGRNGIHLRQLYAGLRERPALAHLTDPQLRTMLDHYQVPVVRSLSVDGVDGRTGIRRADVEALLSPSESSPSRPTETAPDQQESGPLSVPLSPRSRSYPSQPHSRRPRDHR